MPKIESVPSRFYAIDLLRILMSVQMIQGHTIASLLTEEARRGWMFETWTFVRGLTAVGFLVAAGASYSVVMGREGEVEAMVRGRARRIRRALLLIGVGFALRPPIGLFTSDAEAALRALDAFLSVDVLQCIGVTLLCLEGLRRVVPVRAVPAVCGALALLLIVSAPFLATLEADRPWRWALDWVNRRGGSLFPLFPWSGFVFAGVGLGALVARSKSLSGSLGLVGAGLAFALLGRALMPLVPRVAPDDYYAWPPFSLMRLGLVVTLLGVLSLAALRIHALPRWMSILASQTLVLYVVHLVILHAGGIGLIALFGPHLSPSQAVLVAVLLIGVSGAAALTWPRLSQRLRSRAESAA